MIWFSKTNAGGPTKQPGCERINQSFLEHHFLSGPIMVRAAPSNKSSAPLVPISECLFGPERTCPINVWEAVLSPHEDVPVRPKALSSTASNSRCISLTGIDDFHEGRWADGKATQRIPHVIVLQELRRIVSQGIVDEGCHRPLTWRVLLNYLPLSIMEWKPTLLQQRTLYRHLAADLFLEPQHDGNDLRGHHGKRNWSQRKLAMTTMRHDDKDRHHDYNHSNRNNNTSDNYVQDTEIPTDIRHGHNSIPLPRESHSQSKSTGNQGNSSPEVPAPLHSKPAPEGMLQDIWDQRNKEMTQEQSSITVVIQPQNEPAEEEGNDDVGFAQVSFLTTPITRTETEWIKKQSDLKETNEIIVIKKDSFNNDDGSGNGVDGDHDEAETESCRTPSRSDRIPPRIRDEWKKTGRDLQALDQMGILDSSMNTLLVIEDEGTKRRVSVTDDPLSTEADSKWFQFFENASLLDEIRKDVVRTHPDLYFFLEPENNLGQRRYAALERILFVWAKLNKGVRYVQGMNEIVGTIYYVLANDMNEEWACEAEADTYFLFNTLMTEMRDIFVPDLDDADTGIQGRISNMTTLLSLHDPEVRCHLDDMGIDASFYAIRWLTTLLSREFLLPDTIRLWDSMFASTHKDNFMRYVCVTMVMIIRTQLLKGDFSSCLRLLQSYPTSNIDSLLESSRALWIYESQVTLACHKGGMSLHQALTTITPPPSLLMAYGLVGGIATQVPMIEEDTAPSSRAGILLSGAKTLLGALGREVRPKRSGWNS